MSILGHRSYPIEDDDPPMCDGSDLIDAPRGQIRRYLPCRRPATTLEVDRTWDHGHEKRYLCDEHTTPGDYEP